MSVSVDSASYAASKPSELGAWGKSEYPSANVRRSLENNGGSKSTGRSVSPGVSNITATGVSTDKLIGESEVRFNDAGGVGSVATTVAVGESPKRITSGPTPSFGFPESDEQPAASAKKITNKRDNPPPCKRLFTSLDKPITPTHDK
jgi:hypothetical protein